MVCYFFKIMMRVFFLSFLVFFKNSRMSFFFLSFFSLFLVLFLWLGKGMLLIFLVCCWGICFISIISVYIAFHCLYSHFLKIPVFCCCFFLFVYGVCFMGSMAVGGKMSPADWSVGKNKETVDWTSWQGYTSADWSEPRA